MAIWAKEPMTVSRENHLYRQVRSRFDLYFQCRISCNKFTYYHIIKPYPVFTYAHYNHNREATDDVNDSKLLRQIALATITTNVPLLQS